MSQCAKQRHPDQSSAMFALNRWRKDRKPKNGDKYFEVYKCEECSVPGAPVWHFGHIKSKKKRDGGKC